MKSLSLAIAFCAATAAVGRADFPGRAPGDPGRQASSGHPAVVRIMTPQRDGMAFGSGTLVATNQTQGLIVTNWHVVENPAGPITVLFPDGFCSTATVLRADRDWDLAALTVWRPNAEPVPIADRAPRPGEALTIAGYGNGAYRAAAGRCTQYVAPSRHHPYEMVEVSATARQGDSGGPIFNGRGELAGVLFGTGGGSTTGSYCGRVRAFLRPILGDPLQTPSDSAVIAQRSAPRVPDADGTPLQVAQEPAPAGPMIAQRSPAASGWSALGRPDPPPPARGCPETGTGTPHLVQGRDPTHNIREPVPVFGQPHSPAATLPPAVPAPPVAAIAGRGTAAEEQASSLAPLPISDAVASDAPSPMTVHRAALPRPAPLPTAWDFIGGTTPFEQSKSVLAVVGLLAVLFHGLRLLSKAEQSAARQAEDRRRSQRSRRKAA